MWSKLVPVACVVAVGLQGCLFADFPWAVKVAVGHACDNAADGVSEEEGLKAFGENEGCDGLNTDTLNELGVESCAEAMQGIIKDSVMFKCEADLAVALEEVCKEASAECKEKLESTMSEWNSGEIP